MDANTYLNKDVTEKMEEFARMEDSPIGKEILEQLLVNALLAANEQMPMCQDTGVAVVFVELGQDLHIIGGDFTEAINEGVRQGYRDGYLRKSIVDDPGLRTKEYENQYPRHHSHRD